MLIVPLIFSTILVGIGKTGDIKAVGRMGVKALVYFEIASTAALAIGLTIAHLVRPGDGLKLPPSGEHLAKPLTLVETLLHLFPSNVVDAMIEQPLDDGDLLDHAALQKELETPICLDESITGLHAARQALDLGSCRIVNM